MLRPQLTEPYGLHAYDLKLFIELSQHAVLVANGWEWGVGCKQGEEARVMWKAPPGHRGSSQFYEHRQHAYNSHMKWNHPYLYPPEMR